MDTDKQSNPNPKEQSPKQQVVEALKSANNVLITISNSPSVDQLASCIGLTLMMNKLGKHATAVFSGAIPSTLDFLEPQKTIETNTDSLRDFIIALDKSKADKIRYKVEDDVVRIYITPYRTSINEADLDFTQGDFNVDAVVALGITSKDQLDGAIIEHGQILHDAIVLGLSVGTNPQSELGSVNWHEPTASSLSEMLVSISESFKTGLLDTQMATAFLTGIVSETDRFSNDKTTPKVMTISAQLMAAGANQQLIANQLAIPPEPIVSEAPAETIPEQTQSAPGELDISHGESTIDQVEQGSTGDGLAFSVRDDPKPEDHATVDVNDVASTLGASHGDVTNTKVEAEHVMTEEEKLANKIDIDEHGRMTDLEAEALQQQADVEQSLKHGQRVIQPLGAEPPKPKTDLSTVTFDEPTPTTTEQGAVGLPTIPQMPSQATEPATEMPSKVSADPLIPVVNEEQQPADPLFPVPENGVGQTLEDIEHAVNSPHVGGTGEISLPSPEMPAESQANEEPVPPAVPPPFPMNPPSAQ